MSNATFSAAQRAYDNQLPDPDPPYPEGAADCSCGRSDSLYFDKTFAGDVQVRCTCGRCGPAKLWTHEAVESWTAEIESEVAR